MESTSLISPTMDILIAPLALLFFIAWIIRRRLIRRKEIKVNKLEKKPYTTSQIFGIIGILIFILPIFWVVGGMLLKGLYFLVILFFGWIEFPNTVAMIIKTIFHVSTHFLFFSGVYLVCEMMWPKKYLDKVKSVAKESVEPKKT